MSASRSSEHDVQRVARELVRLYGEGAVSHAFSQIQKLKRAHAYVAAGVMAEVLRAIRELQPPKRGVSAN